MRKLLGLAVALIAIATAAPAAASSDPLVKTASDLIKAGKSAQAYALLRPQRDASASDPDYNYALGLAAMDSNHVTEAILAFQRVLAITPDQTQARAELARAYAMSGDIDTARREFDTVAGDPTIPDPVRQRFNTVVKRLDRTLKPGSNLTGFVEAGGGYDSNVNAATSAAQLLIPVFSFLGPATLSTDARSQSDGFGSIAGGISEDFGFDRQSHVFASLLGTARFNGTQSQLNQTLGTATVGYSYTAANHDVASISAQTQQFLLGGARYRSATGIIAQYTHRLAGGSALSAQVEGFDIVYPTDRLRNARRFGGAITYAARHFYIAAQGGHEAARNAQADNLSNAYGGLRASFDYRLAGKVAVFGTFAFETRRYDAADQLFLIRRRDNQYDASLGLHIALLPHVSFNPQVGYTRNDSNIAIDDYRRFTAAATVRFEF